MFCDEDCMEYRNFHAKECGFGYDDGMEYYLQFGLRSILIGIDAFVEEVLMNNNPSKEMPISTADSKTKYRLFLTLNVRRKIRINYLEFILPIANVICNMIQY